DSEGASIVFPAGPTELLIIADEFADPKLIAWDLAAQAEHGENSNVLLLTDSQEIAGLVSEALTDLPLDNTRKEIIYGCLEKSYAIVTNSIDEAIIFSNKYAPEHLSLHIENPESVSDNLKNAGTVFLGKFTPPAAGDYATGANHTLPTNGYAKSFSSLSVSDFQKFITFQKIEERGLEAVATTVTTLAEAESLFTHSGSIKARFDDV
ncbi:MAG: histidinol dehydrogenase, partial [Candidatus Marinimicrobia bacterium]|nr:histidinol dehydrogenase [Candidatus Neomarinimicrobiota bacterium]